MNEPQEAPLIALEYIFEIGCLVISPGVRSKWTSSATTIPENLESALQQFASQYTITSLMITVSAEYSDKGDFLVDTFWVDLGKTIQKCLPHLQRLFMFKRGRVADKHWVTVLQHMPQSLTTLSMFDADDRDESTVVKIGASLKQLRVLEIRFVSTAGTDQKEKAIAGKRKLADLLSSLPCLRKVTISGLKAAKSEDLEPIIAALQCNPRLEGVRLRVRGWDSVTDGGGSTQELITPQQLEAIQCGPRINAAKRKFFVQGDDEMTREQWLEALISVQDRFDCFSYFLSLVDPSVLAGPAVAAALRRQANRKVYVGFRGYLIWGLL